jgi:hypothetical protein
MSILYHHYREGGAGGFRIVRGSSSGDRTLYISRWGARASTTLDTIWTMVFHGKNVVETSGANGIGVAISRTWSLRGLRVGTGGNEAGRF